MRLHCFPAKSYAIAEGEIIVYYVFILHEDSTRTIVVPTTGSREFDLVILNPHAVHHDSSEGTAAKRRGETLNVRFKADRSQNRSTLRELSATSYRSGRARAGLLYAGVARAVRVSAATT